MAQEVVFASVVPRPLFPTGLLVATAGVDALIWQGRLNPTEYLRRHLSGDWGDLPTTTGARTTWHCSPARIACFRPTRSRRT